MNGKMTLSPVTVGIAAATGAVALGWLYLLMAGAPPRMLLLNPASLLVGIAAVMVLRAAASLRLRGGGLALIAISVAVVATALLGQSVDNASRWVSLAGITIQPGLMFVPALAVAFAARQSRWSAAAVAIAAAGIALQPDRAMAGALLAGVAATAAVRRGPIGLAALGAAFAAFIITLLRPDALPAVPFVDGVLYTSFAVSPMAGLAVVAGSAMLLSPLLCASNQAMRPRLLAFAFTWVAVIAAAAIGNYPTPLVGFGGSAIVGYLLSVAMLRSPASSLAPTGASDAALEPLDASHRQDRLDRARPPARGLNA